MSDDLGDAGGIPTINAASICGYDKPRSLFLQNTARKPKGFFLMVESDLHTENIVQGLERAVALDRIIQRTAERMKAGHAQGDPPVADVLPVVATDPVTDDPDDPAIWVHPSDPTRSLILGTNKVAAPRGALIVFGLDGKIRQSIDHLDRPNNVDVEYSLRLGSERVDIAVLTERRKNRLRVFRSDAETCRLEDISAGGSIRVFEGQQGEQAAPMGIALYRRPRDGAVFAIVSRKSGPGHDYLWQYRLEDDGAGKVKGGKVREFGSFSGRGEIEAVAVDDELGYV